MSAALKHHSNTSLDALEARVRSRLAPPPRESLSEWAEAHRVLSSETSARPGRWKNHLTPYLVEIMDAFSSKVVREIYVQSAAQVGKTEVLLNAVGYVVHRTPAPVLVLFPGDKLVKAFSEKRIKPMLRDTPELRELVTDPKVKDTSTTIEEKPFPGGYLTMATCGSAANLSARPIRFVGVDELDRAPDSAGEEGDIIELAKKRSDTFYNRKLLAISSPVGCEQTSKINARYKSSKRYVYHCPCPRCSEFFEWTWEQVEWDEGRPKSARIVCPKCKGHTTDAKRRELVACGRWHCLDPEADEDIVGFHMKGLVSPWVRLSDFVKKFINARGNPFKMKVFYNTDLGETWEEETESINPSDLYSSRETYELAPEEVLCVTAGVDLGDDHAHVEFVGWGLGEESWSLDYVRHQGDPGKDSFWCELEDILLERFETEDGRTLPVSCICVDSGGHHTTKIYDFVRGKTHRRIFAIKGVKGWGKPLVGSVSKKRTGRESRNVDLYPLCVNEGKATVYGRLKLAEGPGACHFPKKDSYDRDYFQMLTAEKLRSTFQRGQRVREWYLPEHRRNEALDCRVYASAAFILLRPRLDILARRVAAARDEEKPKKDKSYTPRKSWVTRGTSWEKTS